MLEAIDGCIAFYLLVNCIDRSERRCV